MTIALVRELSPGIVHCELTHLAREPIDLDRARRQHASYVEALRESGCRVIEVDPLPDAPDGVFVEDTAVVLDEIAIITRPGAPSRRLETPSVEAALRPFRTLVSIEAPATLDGGDVLRSGGVLFVGSTERTSAEGALSLARAVEPFGYEVRTVPVTGCLHLKSAVTEIADGLLLVNPDWVDPARFAGCRTIAIDPGESFAANGLRIGQRVIYATAFPKTAARIRAEGIEVRPVDADELAKAEGAVTCCSLIVA
jgi:dimethylargininase